MRRMPGILALVGLAVAFAAPARAEEGKNALRYQVSYFTASGDFKSAEEDLKVKYQATLGTGLGYEYRFDDLVGLDVALRIFKPEIKASNASGSIEKRVRVLPLTIGAMFHFVKTDTVQFYAGPELAYISYGTIEFSPAPEDKVDLKSELTWGVKGGVDVPFNETWAFMAAVEYLDAKSKTDLPAPAVNENLNAKPIIVTVGVVYKF